MPTTSHSHWTERARCRGVEVRVFYPDTGQRSGEAKAYCANCPVRAACLEYALATGERYGVWGGLNEDERRRVRRLRAASA